jgi:zinc transporter
MSDPDTRPDAQADGLVCAYVLDGLGGGRLIESAQIGTHLDGFLWVHLQRTGKEARRWLWEESGLDWVVCNALLGSSEMPTRQWIEEGHSQSMYYKGGISINLRGVNLNPGADENDMITVRAWFDSDQVITVRERHVEAIKDIRGRIAASEGPTGPADFLVLLAERLADRIGVALASLQEVIDDMEMAAISEQAPELRNNLGSLRRRAIAKRRHLLPQRDALSRLSQGQVPWMEEHHRAQLSAIADRTALQVEDLQALRERAAVIQDEIMNQLSAGLNRTMYLLSVIAAIFLPLGFVTGLLGVNLAGIPGREWPWAFPVACIVFAAIGAIEVWLFRRWKLF